MSEAPMTFKDRDEQDRVTLYREIARLTRELSEAREAIYTAPIETDGSGCYKGRAIEWFYLPAVRAVIEEGKR